MRIVATADVHGFYRDIPKLPDGDVLVLAGDLTKHGTLNDLEMLNQWIGDVAAHIPHRLIIAGNHDWAFQDTRPAALDILTNATYLENSDVMINEGNRGIKFWGSPITPRFYNWAFMQDRGVSIRRVWSQIPRDTDVLITHGPPLGILDQNRNGQHCGCEDLLQRLQELSSGKVHIYGHIHEGYGSVESKGNRYYNVSACTAWYEASNLPVVIDI